MKKPFKLIKLIGVEYSTSSITIGQYFREERLRCSMPEDAAAQALGVSVEALLDYESGRVQIPFDVIYDIAQLYSSSIEDVLDLLSKVSFPDVKSDLTIPIKKNQQG